MSLFISNEVFKYYFSMEGWAGEGALTILEEQLLFIIIKSDKLSILQTSLNTKY